MKTQTLNLENHEVVILILTLNGMLSTLEKDKKMAKSEINNLKTLIKKVNKLEIDIPTKDSFTL
jgi:hypothetical protein